MGLQAQSGIEHLDHMDYVITMVHGTWRCVVGEAEPALGPNRFRCGLASRKNCRDLHFFNFGPIREQTFVVRLIAFRHQLQS